MLNWRDEGEARARLIAEVEMAMEAHVVARRPDLAAKAAVDIVLNLAWDRVEELADGVEVLLEEPIDAYGEKVQALKLRKLRGKDMRASASCKTDEDRTLFLIQRSAGIPPSSIDRMSMADILACGEAIERFFLTRSPTVGRPSPPT